MYDFLISECENVFIRAQHRESVEGFKCCVSNVSKLEAVDVVCKFTEDGMSRSTVSRERERIRQHSIGLAKLPFRYLMVNRKLKVYRVDNQYKTVSGWTCNFKSKDTSEIENSLFELQLDGYEEYNPENHNTKKQLDIGLTAEVENVKDLLEQMKNEHKTQLELIVKTEGHIALLVGLLGDFNG